MEFILCVLFNYDEIKFDKDNKYFSKCLNLWRLNNLSLNNEWVKDEIKEKINKKFFKRK